MKAYKFLRVGRVAPFSEVVWPEGGWVEAQGPLDPCRSGVHACRPRHLPYWLGEELWAVELAGDRIETDLQVVAERGRLQERVGAWDEDARRDFAAECVRRTADYAAAELREQGPDAATLAGYAEDAAGYAAAGDTAGAAFVAAHAAELHAPPGVSRPFEAERAEQARWLADRLGLSAADA
ncbi:MAG TPA: hypothetical protein VEY87_06610 [Gaiellaceae bacterium]|jgi:hypothetical protein|nr:hypothetical protein [Gaiellaceae bacterium]